MAIIGLARMKACVGSPGRFHTFDLARQLARAGALQHLYTGYPRRKVDGLSPERVSTFPWLTVAAHGAGRLGFHSIQRSLNWPLIRTFDSWLSGRIEALRCFPLSVELRRGVAQGGEGTAWGVNDLRPGLIAYSISG